MKKSKPIFEHDLTPFQSFKWHTEQLRDLLQGNKHNLHTIFKAWYHVCRRQHARSSINATSKEARKRRLQTIYEAANRAETAKDSFQFYQCISELSPKLPLDESNCDRQQVTYLALMKQQMHYNPGLNPCTKPQMHCLYPHHVNGPSHQMNCTMDFFTFQQ